MNNKNTKLKSHSAEIYAEEALNQISRLLGMIDRNAYSLTFGCADRNYWLDKSTDFPSSIYQYSVHALAIVYSKKFPNNIYYRQPKIKKWILGMMDYWQKIQKNDGSFDEFYPNERGWAGPTGFLLYAMLGAYELIQEEFPEEKKHAFFQSCIKAAHYLAKYDEHGILANHHAMALLPIYYAAKVTGDRSVLHNFSEKLDYFLNLQSKEGWYLEYDGADLGYLSASISFMTKLLKFMDGVAEDRAWKEKIETSIPPAIHFASYFAYPNGFYAGTMGSRQTLHFYPHGFEVWAKKIPEAAAVAEHLAQSIREQKLVPPKIMADRYLAYRVNEFLVTYLDAFERDHVSLEKLPWQGKEFENYFEHACIYIKNTPHYYALVNLAKGGVVKVFNKQKKLLTINDCGMRLQDENGIVYSTQWIDSHYHARVQGGKTTIEGNIYRISNELPTPLKMMALRGVLLTLGENTDAAYKIKGKIRERIILKNKPSVIQFKREITFMEKECVIRDEIQKNNFTTAIARCTLGDEFSIRYVPQSLYFQSQELGIEAYEMNKEQLHILNQSRSMTFTRTYSIESGALTGVEQTHD